MDASAALLPCLWRPGADAEVLALVAVVERLERRTDVLMDRTATRAARVARNDDVVVVHEAITNGRFDAAGRGDSADDDRLHAVAAQELIESGTDERAVAMLFEDELFRSAVGA